MFDKSRQFQAAWQRLEDRLVEEQNKVLEDWKKKAEKVIDDLNDLAERIKKKYPELEKEDSDSED